MIQSYKEYLQKLSLCVQAPNVTMLPWKLTGLDASFFELEKDILAVPIDTKRHIFGIKKINNPLMLSLSKHMSGSARTPTPSPRLWRTGRQAQGERERELSEINNIIISDLVDFFAKYPEYAQKYFFDLCSTDSFQHLWSMFAHMHAQRRMVVYVPPATRHEEMFVLDNDTACIEQITIIIAQGARVRMHERMFADGGKRMKNIDVILEKNTYLEFIIEEQDKPTVPSYLHYRFFLYDHAQLDGYFLQRGGVQRTMTFDIVLCAPGAQADLKGISLLEPHQRSSLFTYQRHQAKNTRSSVIAKGIVADAAQAIYYGTITIDKEASGTESYQQNKNMVLGKYASVFSQPNLEIHTNDVFCKHGSAVGTFDSSHILYLQSRGLSLENAYTLLYTAFMQDVVHDIIKTSTELLFMRESFDQMYIPRKIAIVF